MKNTIIILFLLFILGCSSDGKKYIGHWVASNGSELNITAAGDNAFSITEIGADNGSSEGSFGSMFRGKSIMTGMYENGILKAEMGITFSYQNGKIIYNGVEFTKK